jgi:hypothetical protein
MVAEAFQERGEAVVAELDGPKGRRARPSGGVAREAVPSLLSGSSS